MHAENNHRSHPSGTLLALYTHITDYVLGLFHVLNALECFFRAFIIVTGSFASHVFRLSISKRAVVERLK